MIQRTLNAIGGILIRPVHTYRAVNDTSPRECGGYFFWLLCAFALGKIALAAAGVEDSYLVQGVPVACVFILTIILAGYFFLFFDTFIINYATILVGGRIQDHSVFRVLAYSATPALLFGWIPLVGFVGVLYSLILEIIGIRELLGLSYSKSILAIVLSLAAMLIVTIAYSGVPYFIAAPSPFIELGYIALGGIILAMVATSLWREVIREVL
jgi:glucan phosphoethanolaminetransferase (alkaline phosphatase superfamily)